MRNTFQKDNLWYKGDKLGAQVNMYTLPQYIQYRQTYTHNIDKQQGPTIQHRELYTMFCNNLQWKKLKRIYIFFFRSLCHTPKANTHCKLTDFNFLKEIEKNDNAQCNTEDGIEPRPVRRNCNQTTAKIKDQQLPYVFACLFINGIHQYHNTDTIQSLIKHK